MELKIKCEACEEESYPTVYLYDEQIVSHGIPFSDHKDYIAFAKGRSVCPRCGHINHTVFESDIYRSEIIDLAVRRCKR